MAIWRAASSSAASPAGSVERDRALRRQPRAGHVHASTSEFAPLPRRRRRPSAPTSLAGHREPPRRADAARDGRTAETIADGGDARPTSQTVSEVDLDELFNTLDPRRSPTSSAWSRASTGRLDAASVPTGEPRLPLPQPAALDLAPGPRPARSDRRGRCEQLLVDSVAALRRPRRARARDSRALVANLNVATGRDRPPARRAHLGDREAARLPAPVEHHVRQPARRRRRPRAADRRHPPGRRAPRPVLHRVPRPPRGAVPTLRDLDVIAAPRRGRGQRPRRADPAARRRLLAGGARARAPRLRRQPGERLRQRRRRRLRPGRARARRTARSANSLPILAHFRRLHARAGRLVRRLLDQRHARRERRHRPHRRHLQRLHAREPRTGCRRSSRRSIRPTSSAPAAAARSSTSATTQRCPGALERDPGDGSTPFTDGGDARLRPDPGRDRPMRRIASSSRCASLGRVGWAVAGAGADDTRTYRIEMLNAFGVFEGSDVRIAGVRVGHRHRRRGQRGEARRGRRSSSPASSPTLGERDDLHDRAAVADRRVLHRLHARRATPLPEDATDPRRAGRAVDPDRPALQHLPRALPRAAAADRQRARHRDGRRTPRTSTRRSGSACRRSPTSAR